MPGAERPSASPSSSALMAEPRLALNSRLFRILATWPAPMPPRCTIGSAYVANTGRTRSTTSSSPPTITSSVPGRGGGLATAHRRVDERNALGGSLFRELPAGVRVHCGVDGDDAAGRQSGQHTVLAVEHLADVVVADHTQADQVTGGGQFGGGAGGLGPGIGEGFQGRRPPRPQGGLEAAFDNPPGHRRALAAQPDKSDSHQRASTSTSVSTAPFTGPWRRPATHSSANDSTAW